MARDRQRAKQRKARRAQNPGPAPSRPHRENVPGELDHASGRGRRVRGRARRAAADGEPAADPDEVEREALAEEIVEDEVVEDEAGAEVEAELDEEPLEGDDDAEPATEDERRPYPEKAPSPGSRPSAAPAASSPSSAPPGPSSSASSGPTAARSAQATAVVLGFVVIAGAYLGLADAVAQEIVDLII